MNPDCFVNLCDLYGDCPDLDARTVSLTVYGPAGSCTVLVREDSIEVKDGSLIAEGPVGTADVDRLFTFPNVLGYSTL